MQLEINKEPKKINQRYLDSLNKDADTKVVGLVGGLKGIYNPLRYWGKIIDLQTMTLVAEISTPIITNEEQEQNYLPRFREDYFTMAGYELAQ